MIATATQSNFKQAHSIKLEGLPAIHSPEAERALLGAMLSEPDLIIDQALEKNLQPEDFFNPSHQELFRALSDMRKANIPIDVTTVLQYLEDRKLADSIGGASLLGELSAGVVSVLTSQAHIDTVRHKSLLRRLQTACAQIVYQAHERQHEAEEVVDEAETLIFQIAEKNIAQTISKADIIVHDAVKLITRITENKNRGNEYSGIPTGFFELDKLTTGFKGGEMIVLAARPGVGKTALALSFVKNIIKQRYNENEDRFEKPGYPVGFFSLEMTNQQLMLRLLASHASLSLQKIRNGDLTKSEIAALSDIASEVSSLPLYLDESPALSVSQLRAKARRMRQAYGIEMIFIDYLQLLTSTSSKAKDNRQVEVSEVSRGIKALALELNIPVVVLAQLNRRPEETNSEPALHHLRESGSIEQDADVVMLLNRVENKDGEEEIVQHGHGFASRARLTIAKQRNGPTDRIDLLFRRDCTLFENMPREAH